VLHARLDLITADPRVLGGCIKYIESEVRPAVESISSRTELAGRLAGAAQDPQAARHQHPDDTTEQPVMDGQHSGGLGIGSRQ
jgi:hypothetical protein